MALVGSHEALLAAFGAVEALNRSAGISATTKQRYVLCSHTTAFRILSHGRHATLLSSLRIKASE